MCGYNVQLTRFSLQALSFSFVVFFGEVSEIIADIFMVRMVALMVPYSVFDNHKVKTALQSFCYSRLTWHVQHG